MRTLAKTILMVVTVALVAEVAAAERFEIVQGDGSGVVFESKATLDSFKGHTRSVHGWFEADLNDLGGQVAMEVVVDLATFDTGIGKRNGHMRDNHLETDTYPQTVFRGGEVANVRKDGGRTVFDLAGELDLHGVVQPRTIEIGLERKADGTVVIETQFVVKLSDHAIKRPKFLVMKLADEQKVFVKLEARPGTEGGVGE